MRLTRVFVDADLTAGSSVELPRDTGAHLAKVLRARGGEELILFNGDGREFTGSIEAVRGTRVTASIGTARLADKESPLDITLLQCIPRGDRMDFIVQKSTELGVTRIVPVLSQRSVVRLNEEQAVAKQAHWQAVAISACEQCGRNRLPEVQAARDLLKYLDGAGSDDDGTTLRLVLEPETASAGDAARAIQGEGAGKPTAVIIAIGPEGGFSADELEAFRLCRFMQLGLGPRVLRTETAALAAIVMLQTRLGDMSSYTDA